MIALRRVLAAAIIAVCVSVAAVAVIPRWRCNVEVARVESELTELRSAPEHRAVIRARELAQICRRCLAVDPGDYRHQYLLGRALYEMGALAEAEQSLRRAVELNERPEIMTWLGIVQLERGDAEAAWRSLIEASIFNPSSATLVSPSMEAELFAIARERFERLQRKLPPEKRQRSPI